MDFNQFLKAVNMNEKTIVNVSQPDFELLMNEQDHISIESRIKIQTEYKRLKQEMENKKLRRQQQGGKKPKKTKRKSLKKKRKTRKSNRK